LLGSCRQRIYVTNSEPRTVEFLRHLRPLGEAEIGIGFTVILAAASLTSRPPAVDLRNGRLTMSEIANRFQPKLPRLASPPVSTLSPSSPLPDLRAPAATANEAAFLTLRLPTVNTPADIAWSEYTHHWSGIIVAATGLMALLSRFTCTSDRRIYLVTASGIL